MIALGYWPRFEPASSGWVSKRCTTVSILLHSCQICDFQVPLTRACKIGLSITWLLLNTETNGIRLHNSELIYRILAAQDRWHVVWWNNSFLQLQTCSNYNLWLKQCLYNSKIIKLVIKSGFWGSSQILCESPSPKKEGTTMTASKILNYIIILAWLLSKKIC